MLDKIIQIRNSVEDLKRELHFLTLDEAYRHICDLYDDIDSMVDDEIRKAGRLAQVSKIN